MPFNQAMPIILDRGINVIEDYRITIFETSEERAVVD